MRNPFRIICVIRFESYESEPTTNLQHTKNSNPKPIVNSRKDGILSDTSETVPPKEVKQEQIPKAKKTAPKEHTRTTAFKPTYTLTVFYKFLSFRRTMVIKNENKKRLYQIKRANFDLFHPTVRLLDVNKNVIAYVVKSKAIFSHTIRYKFYLQDDLLSIVYQEKKNRETFDFSELEMFIEGNICKYQYSVFTSGSTPVIKVTNSAKRRSICAIEYLSKEDEILGLLILMMIKLAFKKEQKQEGR